MANVCSNNIVIKTSVDHTVFLSQHPEEEGLYILDLQESVLPFNNKDGSLAWGTKWFVCNLCTLNETVNTVAPPEPTPIIITQGTRRYPVLQRMPFVTYTYKVWDIMGDSAWAPPVGYLNALYEKLRKLDDRTSIECWYYEPGVGFLGCWKNGVDQETLSPDLYYPDSIDSDVAYNITEFQANVISHFEDNIISYEEALTQVTPEELVEMQEYFNL